MATKLYKVVTNDNLRVRTSPDLSRANLVPNRFLVRDDILEVRADSCTEAGGWFWWEHAASPGFWTSSQNSSGTIILMEEYKPEHIITPTPESPKPAETTQIFEVLEYLNVRTAPKFGNNLTGERLSPGVRMAFRNPTIADNYQWWEIVDKPGKWASSGSLSGGAALMRPVKEPEATTENVYKMVVPWITQIQSGINFANDCGHTCTLMTMRYLGKGWDKTVGDLYALKTMRHERGWTTNANLKDIAGHFGVQMVTFAKQMPAQSDIEWLKEILRTNGPVIILVWYPSLGFSNSANGPFNHWVVLTGYSDNRFYMNDPLWTTENKGANREVSGTTLLRALQTTNSSNHLMGLYPNKV